MAPEALGRYRYSWDATRYRSIISVHVEEAGGKSPASTVQPQQELEASFVTTVRCDQRHRLQEVFPDYNDPRCHVRDHRAQTRDDRARSGDHAHGGP